MKQAESRGGQRGPLVVAKGQYWEPKGLSKPTAGTRKKGVYHPEFLVSYNSLYSLCSFNTHDYVQNKFLI